MTQNIEINEKIDLRAGSGKIEKLFHGSSSYGYFLGINWVVNSQSTSSNSSNVTATVYIRTTGSGVSISSSASKNVGININGTNYTSTCTVGVGTNSTKNLLSKTVTVGHDGNGNKTCSFSCSLGINVTLSGTYYGTITHSGSGTFNTINLNTPPAMYNNIRTNPSGTIPENVNSITLSWDKAGDSQNNANQYRIYRYVNGVHSDTFWINNINQLSYTDNFSGLGQGTRIDYTMWAKDTYDTWSNAIYAHQIVKNTFRGANFTGHSNDVGWNTTQFSLYVGNASNTNGNGSFNYHYYSDDVTIYNSGETTSTTGTIKIWRDTFGEPQPSGAYIKFSDLKNRFRGSNFNGRLHVGVRTTNAYGSQAWSGGSIGVDLRTKPSSPSSVTITGGSAKFTHPVTRNEYYIPDGTKKVEFTFAGGEDVIKEPHRYIIYQLLDGVETEIARVDSNSRTHYVILPKQTSTRNLNIRVKTLTSYGYSSDNRDSSAITLHYYNAPTLDVIKMDRKSTSATATVKLNANTSIPNINFPTRSYSGASSGTLTNTVNQQTITVNSLSDGSKYTWNFTFNDDTGLTTSNRTASTEIPAYTPLFSVREKGVGINAIPDGTAGLIVKKGAKIEGGLTVDGKGFTGQRNLGSRKIEVGGDKNTYYPVLLTGNSNWGFATNTISISRYYSWKAPDSWNTATHKGGLTFTFTWAGDGTWGGNSRYYTVEEFSETYTTMIGGMLNTTSGMVVWLRGGGAEYQIDNDYGRLLGVAIHLGTFTASDNKTYPVRTNTNSVAGEVTNRFCVRDNQLYDSGSRVYSAINKPSASDIGALPITGGTISGNIALNTNGKTMSIGAGGTDCYIVNSRSNQYLQLRDDGGLDYNNKPIMYNTGTFGTLHLTDWFRAMGNSGFYFQTHGGGWQMTDSTWIRAYGGKSVYMAHGRLKTENAFECRYIDALGGQNLDISTNGAGTLYLNLHTSSGTGINMNRAWSGSSGSEPSIYNSKGNGWGYLGNSGWSFFRVYGTSGSVSDRNKKYHITKSNEETQYDNVKDLNIYNYRSISTKEIEIEEMAEKLLQNTAFKNEDDTLKTESIEVDGHTYREIKEKVSQEEIKQIRIKEISKNHPEFGEVKRQDLTLGAMVDELPTEVTFYDNEGGDGKAVDMYSYTTMIMGATKHLITKVENLEKENEVKDTKINDLELRLEKMEELINGFINKG